jgi:hypothetical protein
MLHALAEEHSSEIWWLHGARSNRDHSFAEARGLSPRSKRPHPCLLQPAGPGRPGSRDFDNAGRLTAAVLVELAPPRDAEAYLCGPTPFMDEISAALSAMGIDARASTEPFGPAPGLTPGIAATPARTPHPPAGQPERPDDRVRPQRPHHPLERRLHQLLDRGPATSPSAGRVAPASATTARRRSSQHRRLRPHQSSPPPTAALICCSRPRDDVVLDL